MSKLMTKAESKSYYIKEEEGDDEQEELNVTGYKCSDCGKMFSKKYNMTTHQRALHSSTPNLYTCEECGKQFAFKSNFNTHKNVHRNIPRNFTCHLCPGAFKNARGLRNHLFTHNKSKNFICEICGKHFNTSMNLRNHVATHSDERRHFCDMCTATFKRASHLHQHQREVHHVERSGKHAREHACNECGNRFTTEERLEIHRRKHTGDLPFMCLLCNRGFASQMGLNVHQTMGECQVKTSFCIICCTEYKPGEEPCEHIKLERSKHVTRQLRGPKRQNKVPRKEKPRNFICPVCSKTFIFNCDLKQHYKICHTEERPFVCESCGKRFKAKNTLQNHKATHTDERPFACPYCNKRFRRADQKMLHIRTHTGEKPHVCSVCKRGFAQVGDMKKHKKLHDRLAKM